MNRNQCLCRKWLWLRPESRHSDHGEGQVCGPNEVQAGYLEILLFTPAFIEMTSSKLQLVEGHQWDEAFRKDHHQEGCRGSEREDPQMVEASIS